MRHRLYTLLIEPRQRDDDLRIRELILNVLFVGTLGTLFVALAIICSNYLRGHHYLLPRIESLGGVWAITLVMYLLARSGWRRSAAWFLIALFLLLGVGVAATWGVTFPPAVLLFALVVMMTGMVLGSPYTLYSVIAVITCIVMLLFEQVHGGIHPNIAWARTPLDSQIVIGVCLILTIIALISWLFNAQTMASLHRAQRAEAGLKRQKMLLETKVEERTRELQAAQLDKLQQLYRFAELGQLSTALLHDLANHLTTLTLDIEGLEAEHHSDVLKRAKRSIRYLDNMVLRVRDQLHGKSSVRAFNVALETDEIISLLGHKAAAADVQLVQEVTSDRKNLRCRGDPVRFRQLMANLIGNGIDAYDPSQTDRPREVQVTTELAAKHIVITVTDWGRGITGDDRAKLFEPFFSTKKTGMGMGLFIAKQIAEEHFRGKLTLDASTAHTTFIVTLTKA